MAEPHDWQRLAALLLDAAADQVTLRGAPTWVLVFDDAERPDGFAMSFSHEPDGLLGWVAPDDCQAVGVIATGRLRATDTAGDTAPALQSEDSPAAALLAAASAADDSSEPARIAIACLVARDGSTGWRMRLPGGVETDHPPSEGRLLDCLRRCFGLPTMPAPASPAVLQASAWLADVLEAGRQSGRALTWSEVSRLHPLARLVAGEAGADCSELLPVLTRVAGAAWSWADLRHQVQDFDGLGGLIDPELAAWMDDGMFARWVLSALPSPDDVLAAARPHLVPSAARRLAHAIRVITDVPEASSA
jgi:hypothetical protein